MLLMQFIVVLLVFEINEFRAKFRKLVHGQIREAPTTHKHGSKIHDVSAAILNVNCKVVMKTNQDSRPDTSFSQ